LLREAQRSGMSGGSGGLKLDLRGVPKHESDVSGGFTRSSGQSIELIGGSQPFAIPAVASRTIESSKSDPRASIEKVPATVVGETECTPQERCHLIPNSADRTAVMGSPGKPGDPIT